MFKKSDIKDIYNLTPMQEGMLFHYIMDKASSVYFEMTVLTVSGTIDLDLFEQAFNKLIEKYDVLRTVFIHDKLKTPMQVVLKHRTGSVYFEDITGLAGEEEKESRVKMFQEEDRKRGFRLEKDLPIRLSILKTDAEQYKIFWSSHHIIMDGWCVSIVIRDFIEIYQSLKLGKGVETQQAAPYGRYLEWLQKQDKEEGLGYWKAYLDGYEQPAVLPKFGNRGLEKTGGDNYRVEEYNFYIEDAAALGVEKMAKENQLTVTSVLHAAWGILLQRYNNMGDVVFGTVVSGRPPEIEGIETMVGLFVNAVPVRIQASGDTAFSALIREVQANSNASKPYEYLPLADVQADSPLKGQLIDMLMGYQNYPVQKEMSDAISLEFKVRDVEITEQINYDFNCIVSPGRRFSVNFNYNSRVYQGTYIRQVARHYNRIIGQVTANPHIPVKDIDIMPEEEKRQLLYEWNDTETPFPHDKTLHELFAEQAAKTPDACALVYEENMFTYGVLDVVACRVAGYLVLQKHIRAGECVGILLSRSAERIVAILGILKAGGVYVPLDPSLPFQRLKYMAADAGMGVLISEKAYLQTLNRLQWECEGLHSYICMDSDNVLLEEEADKNELMDEELWRHVGETAVDDITGGGWVSSYTGLPLTKLEMDEYGDNTLKKLEPLLHPRMRVLEIGCASGITMFRIAPRVGFYYGTDLSPVIIQKNRDRVSAEGIGNIKLTALAAHDIERLGEEEEPFDLIILNSVIQCFHGHNYLRKVIRGAAGLLAERGYLFVGDVMDQDRKDLLAREMVVFKNDPGNAGKNYITKTDFSAELFVSRGFWRDLAVEMPWMENVEFSGKIHTVENELTKFRYDALITVNKNVSRPHSGEKRKHQDDRRVLTAYDWSSIGRVDPAHPAYVIYTSGTTGKPRGVMVAHRSVVNLVQGLNERIYGYHGKGLRVSLLAPYVFDASVQQIFAVLLSGHALFVVPEETRADGDGLLQYYAKHHIEISDGTPVHIQLLVERLAFNPPVVPVRHFIIGGEALPRKTVAAFLNYFNSNGSSVPMVTNVYGPTECTVDAVSFDVTADTIAAYDTVPIGRPMPNHRVYILDGRGGLQPPGVAGELWIAGAGVSRGYLNNPELTAERFVDLDRTYKSHGSNRTYLSEEKLYKTGDLTRWLPDGNIEFLGRIDLQVKVRGFRIELGEIEHCLREHEDVIDAAAVVKADVDGGNFLCAYIISEGVLSVPRLREYMSRRLPDYMIPSYIVQLESFPLTRNGKLNRKALPSPEYDVSGQYRAPADEIEEKLALIWEQVLGISKDRISVDADFFELGGHSLKATRLVSLVHKELDMALPLAEVFRTPTIEKLAVFIRGTASAEERFAAIEKAEPRDYYPLSPAQRRIYILYRMEPGTGYNMPMVAALEGRLDGDRLEQAFRLLIQRHESLRTSFLMKDNEPVQRIHEPDDIEFAIEYYREEIHHSSFIVHRFIRPFDLERAPLLRVGLMEPEPGKYILMMDTHHIISDGTSTAILVQEFMAAYRGVELPPLRLQYKDYAFWRNSLRQKEAVKQQEAFWLKVFEGEIPVLNLPVDYPRPLLQSFEGGTTAFELNETDTRALKDLGKKTGTTLYMVLLAVYNVLLSRLSGLEDIIVGTPVAGRRHADLEHIIGMFISTLALRNFPVGEKRFNGFLHEIKTHTLQTFEHQDYPFEDLVEKLDLKKDTSRNPLFDTMFGLQNFDTRWDRIPQVEIEELRLKPFEFDAGTALFDLSVLAVEAGERLIINVEYCTRLFKAATIKRFIGYFRNIVFAVTENPGVRLFEIDILPPEEKRQLLYEFNDTEMAVPTDRTIHGMFEEQVARTPDRTALVGTTHMTYSQLDTDAGRLAALLQEKGVGPDTIVGVRVERSVEMIVGVLAVLKAGGAYMPLDPDYPENRIQYMMQDSGAQLLLTTDDIIKARQSVSRVPRSVTIPESLAYVIYTSGTTGQPKGVAVEHGHVTAYIHATKAVRPVSPHDVKTQTYPFSFDPFAEEVYPVLTSGARLVLVSKEDTRDAEKLVSIIRREQVTIFSTTPAMLNEVNQFPLPYHLAQILVGGDVLRWEHISNIIGRIPVYNYYGPTETVVAAAWYPCTGAVEPDRAIPIGKPLPNSRLYILDGNVNPCPMGVYGELYISGNSVGRGYLNRPELTAERFVDFNRTYKSYKSYGSYLPKGKLYKTGDRARWLPDGNIEFLGRIDNQVKIRGFRIELGEIEARLLRHEAVKEAVVLARNGLLCAYIVTEPDFSAHREPRDYLALNLPAYMIPSYFVPLETFPLTSHKKIDRNALPDPLVLAGEGERKRPENETQEKLLDIWAEILGREKELISIDADFFHMGGHSLKAVQVVNAVHKTLGKRIGIQYLFQYPTIEQLAARISEDETTPYEEIGRLPEREDYALSHTQKRMWVLQKLNPGSAAFNLPVIIFLDMDIDGKVVEAVLEQLVQRHESLRTYFKEKEDAVVQVVLPVEQGVRVNLELIDLSHLGEQDKVKQTGRLTVLENVPIDMQKPPLFRAKLVKLAHESFILYINMHHIISDGWSVDILEREFRLLYESRWTGREIHLEPLRIQYKDYAAWHNALLADERGMNRAGAFWKEQLSGELPVLQLPYDFSPGTVLDNSSAGYRAALSTDVMAGLKEIALSRNTSLFMVLLSGFYITMAFLGGQQDIVIGIPGAARPHEDLKNIIGLFVNTLILRNRAAPDEGFTDFLAGVRQNTLKVLEYQSYPMELICEELKIKYPELNVFFNMINTGSGALTELTDFQARHLESSQDTKFPLTFYISQFSNGIDITCNYFTGLFKPETVEKILAVYLRVLGNIAADPSRQVGQYHKSEKKRSLKRGRKTYHAD